MGLAFYWPFFPTGIFSRLFAHYPTGPSIHFTCYIALMVLIGVFAIVAVALRARIEPAIRKQRTMVVCFGLLCSLGMLVIFNAPLLLANPVPLAIAGVVFAAAGYSLLTFAWANELAGLPAEAMATSVAVAFLAGSLFGMIAYLPVLPSVLLFSASPLLSTLCWRFTTLSPEGETDLSVASLRRLPLGIIGLVVFFIIGGRSVVGMLLQIDGQVPLYERLIVIAVTVVVFAQMRFGMKKSQESGRGFEKLWLPIAILFLVGLTIVTPFGTEWFHVGTGFLSAEVVCLEFYLYLLLMTYVRSERLSPTLVFGLYLACIKVVPILLQRLIIPLISLALGLTAEQGIMSLSVLMNLIVVSGMLIYFTRRTTDDAVKLSNSEQSARVLACEKMGAAFGLSSRETEVALLISQGNSQKRVADELCLSIGTVQSYSKAIYRKMGIHSKQELIDIVNDKMRC